MHILPFKPFLPRHPKHKLFKQIRSLSKDQLTKKTFHHISKPALVLYHIQTPLRTFRGLVCLTALEDLKTGKIAPHEKTLAHREKLTLQGLMEKKGMYKPVLITYPRSASVDQSMRLVAIENDADYIYLDKSASIRHVIWIITDKQLIQKLQQQFMFVEHSFLADGHHRANGMLRWYEDKTGPQEILTAYFDFEQVTVSPYHRIVKQGKILQPDFDKRVNELAFEVKNGNPIPTQKHEFLMMTNDRSQKFKWKDSTLQKAARKGIELLDADILNEFVLRKIFGIKKVTKSDQIIYVEGDGGIGKVQRSVATDKSNVGFCLFPISEQDFVNASLASKTLPPKSTWFQPRLTSGLIMHKF